MKITPRTVESFNDRYVPEPNSGCWLWTASVNKDGYGLISIGNGKTRGAHRVSWMIHSDEDPEGILVCHKCDTPACVNPEHLFLGTHADNARDMTRKGRQVRHKLTPAMVAEMRERHARIPQGWTQARLMREYGLSRTTARLILRGELWKEPGPKHKWEVSGTSRSLHR